MTSFSLAVVADAVHRRGGQQRAVAEVVSRLANRLPVTVIARECAIRGGNIRLFSVRAPARPAMLGTWAFAHAARKAERRAGCTVTCSIGAAALEADVIVAQFCHAAFTSRFGGVRGGKGTRAAYQLIAQNRFVAEERRAYRAGRLKSVIAVSQGTAWELQEYYGVPEAIITVVPNGVDHAVFRPVVGAAARSSLRRDLGLPVGEFLTLFVGGDWERKGLRDAIDTVAGLVDVSLVVVGPGNVGEMRRYARRAGVEHRVILVGPTTTPEKYYAACDVFLFPSRYEAFPLVTLEAAASGLPIIGSAVNGMKELVLDGKNGWLVPSCPDALREKLVLLRDDDGKRALMSRAAVASTARYGWDRIAREQLAVFADIAQRVAR